MASSVSRISCCTSGVLSVEGSKGIQHLPVIGGRQLAGYLVVQAHADVLGECQPTSGGRLFKQFLFFRCHPDVHLHVSSQHNFASI